MDSITQISLGAAIGEAVLGRQIGKRALFWGGFCGLFPDLDVLVPLTDAVEAFTYHRGPSHSLFVLSALTPLFVFLILKLHPQAIEYRKKFYILVFLAFSTHVLLDCFTVYGTQAFWPLSTPPIMGSTIFIIDPIYSVPLITGVIAALVISRRSSRGHLINMIGLTLSSIYLLWSVGAKLHVTEIAHQSLSRQNISYNRLLTIPTAFNTVLWRVLAIDDNGYYEGFYNLLDKTTSIRLNYYSSDKQYLESFETHWPVKRLQWFTHGFYSVQKHGNDIVITDLRMGMEPYYVFRFKIGELGNPHSKMTKSQRIQSPRGKDQLKWIWYRIRAVES
ncbi:MAG: metal-dependent hydrolase [Desulfobacterales bacterium]